MTMAWDETGGTRAARIFRAIGFALDRLGRSANWPDVLDDVLGVYGRAFDVHRMCLCRLYAEEAGIRCELAHEWSAPGVSPRAGWSQTTTFIFEEVGLHRVSEAMAAEVPVSVGPEDFAPQDRVWLGGLQSFIYLPIVLGGQPWGFLGAEDVMHRRRWSELEVEGLTLAARTLGRTVEMLRARDEARGTEERLRAVLEHIPAAVFWKDLELRYEGCSRQMAEWLGLSGPSDIVGRTDADLPLSSEESSFFGTVDRRVMNRDRTERGILEPLIRPDGELRYLRTTKVPLHDSNGQVVGVLGTSLDVTDTTSMTLGEHLSVAESGLAVGIFDLDLRTRAVMCSETLVQLLGLPPGREYSLDTVLGAVFEKERTPLRDGLKAAVKSGSSFFKEVRISNERWMDVRALPVTGPEGSVERVVGFAVDTTHRRRDVERIVELNLRLSKEVEARGSQLEAKDALLDAIATEVPGVLFQTFVRADGSPGVAYLGPGHEQLGFDPHRVEDLAFAGLVPDGKTLREIEGHLDAGNDPEWRLERRVEASTYPRWLRTVARPRRNGDEIWFSGVLLDVTAELEAVASLRASEARLRAVSDALPVGLFLQEQGQLTYVNEAFAGLLGRLASGEDVVRAVHPEDQAALRAALSSALAPPWRRTIEVRAPSAPLAPARWLRVNAAAVRDGDRLLGVAGALEDVTSARRLAEETMAALVRSEELHRLKTRVLSTVSHEFRTPLTAIDMSTQYLEKHLASADARSVRSVQRIRRALGSLSETVEDILMYARIESGRLEVKLEPTALAALVRSVVEQLEAITVRDRVDLEIAPMLENRMVTSDPRLLRTVLANLLSNALKYSREEVVVFARLVEKRIVVSVQDRGIGVVTDELESLTQPFFRGSNVAEPGTGLGLAIARSAAEALGGRLIIESRSGQGTVARLEVPA